MNQSQHCVPFTVPAHPRALQQPNGSDVLSASDDSARQSAPSALISTPLSGTEVEAGADSYLRGYLNMAEKSDKHYLPN